MTAKTKNELRTKLETAIQKIIDSGPPLGTLTTESTASYMAAAAINVLEATKDANDSWEEDGYLTV